MDLQAVHEIHRREGKTLVVVEPGKRFTCPDEEGEGYKESGAAVAVKAEKQAEAPKETAAAKKKRLAAEKKAADEAAAAKDADKSGSSDADDALLN